MNDIMMLDGNMWNYIHPQFKLKFLKLGICIWDGYMDIINFFSNYAYTECSGGICRKL